MSLRPPCGRGGICQRMAKHSPSPLELAQDGAQPSARRSSNVPTSWAVRAVRMNWLR